MPSQLGTIAILGKQLDELQLDVNEVERELRFAINILRRDVLDLRNHIVHGKPLHPELASSSS